MYTSQPTKHTRADREKGHTKNDDDVSDERMKKKKVDQKSSKPKMIII